MLGRSACSAAAGLAGEADAGAVERILTRQALYDAITALQQRHPDATTLERLTHQFMHPFRSLPNLNVVL